MRVFATFASCWGILIWILYSGFHALVPGFFVSETWIPDRWLVRFQIPWAVFQIPKPRILDSGSKNFSDSECTVDLFQTRYFVEIALYKRLINVFFKVLCCPLNISKIWKSSFSHLVVLREKRLLSHERCALVLKCYRHAAVKSFWQTL